MRDLVEMNTADRTAPGGRLLVLGYARTLRSAEPQSLPPALETRLQPWIDRAMQLLRQRLPAQHCIFQDEPVPLESLLPLLQDRLTGILVQAVGTIATTSGELSAEGIAQQFPLLHRLLRGAVSEWVAAAATFLQRLHRDQSRLAASLRISALPAIQNISATGSDVHPGGHSVLRLCFRGGGCLYYKPRPLTGEWLWRALLEAIAQVDPQLALPGSRVFTRNPDTPYGWTASVFPEENFSDSDAAPASDYWHAAGATLCIAQQVRLTDLHLGNILATLSGPAVTDAECLATPTLPSRSSENFSHPHAELSGALQAMLDTGLLPRKQSSDLPDVSGLFGRAAPVPGVRLPAWSSSSDGRLHLTSVAAELVDHGNAPAQTSALAVLPQMLDGYRHAAEVLIRARTSLLAPGSQWRAILEKHHAPRIVLRNTLAYGFLFSQSLEPQNLRSFYRRRASILAALQSGADAVRPAVIRAELSAILQLHVPRLTVMSGSCILGTCSGRPLARHFAASSPAQSVLESIETLSPTNVENVHIPALLAAIC